MIGSSKTSKTEEADSTVKYSFSLQIPSCKIAVFLVTIFLLIPSTFANSSMFLKHLFSVLYSTIFRDFAFPIPFNDKNSSAVALFKSTNATSCKVVSKVMIIYLKIIMLHI